MKAVITVYETRIRNVYSLVRPVNITPMLQQPLQNVRACLEMELQWVNRYCDHKNA
jgi:hypothetical protein